MNKKQRTLGIVGAMFLLLVLIFPPFIEQIESDTYDINFTLLPASDAEGRFFWECFLIELAVVITAFGLPIWLSKKTIRNR